MNNGNELRKVVVVNDPHHHGKVEGYFHAFGYRELPLDNGLYIQVSCAIVEDRDGKVHKFNPSSLKFISEFEDIAAFNRSRTI